MVPFDRHAYIILILFTNLKLRSSHARSTPVVELVQQCEKLSHAHGAALVVVQFPPDYHRLLHQVTICDKNSSPMQVPEEIRERHIAVFAVPSMPAVFSELCNQLQRQVWVELVQKIFNFAQAFSFVLLPLGMDL